MSDEAATADNRAPEPGGVEHVQQVIEAALLAAGEPLSRNALVELFAEDDGIDAELVDEALATLRADCAHRGVELAEVATGYRLQTKAAIQPWISRMWQEKPQRFSRALLETLALIAYRQPITRGEIEDIRGVSVSSSIMRTLQERGWVKAVGHRDVPGRPAVYATTKTFLDYFNLKSLDDLPTLAEIRDIDNLEPELPFEERTQAPAEEGDTEGEGAPTATPSEDDEAGVQEASAEEPGDDAAVEANAPADEPAADAADARPAGSELDGAASDEDAGTADDIGESEADTETALPPEPDESVDDPWDVPSSPVADADEETADTAHDRAGGDKSRAVDELTEDRAATRTDADEPSDAQ